MAALGLRCFAQAFSSCSNQGLLFNAVCGLLIAEASHAEHKLQVCRLQQLQHLDLVGRLSSCGTWAQLLHGMWNSPGPGIKPVSLALAGGFLSTVPLGRSTLPFKPLYLIGDDMITYSQFTTINQKFIDFYITHVIALLY